MSNREVALRLSRDDDPCMLHAAGCHELHGIKSVGVGRDIDRDRAGANRVDDEGSGGDAGTEHIHQPDGLEIYVGMSAGNRDKSATGIGYHRERAGLVSVVMNGDSA